MDHINPSQFQALPGGFKKPNSWKVALLQVLIPVTVFTFLFAYSITWVPSILDSINLFSKFSPSLVDAFINRRAMFLFFNAILIFVAQDSGLISSCMPTDCSSGSEFVRRKGENRQLGHSSAEIILPEEEEVEKGSGKEVVVKGMKAKEEEKAIILKEEEAHEVEEEGMGILSLDELHKRCDEFIQRVKRERRFGSSATSSGMMSSMMGESANTF